MPPLRRFTGHQWVLIVFEVGWASDATSGSDAIGIGTVVVGLDADPSTLCGESTSGPLRSSEKDFTVAWFRGAAADQGGSVERGQIRERKVSAVDLRPEPRSIFGEHSIPVAVPPNDERISPP